MRTALLCIALAGCVSTEYNPTTPEGAQCKRECAKEQSASMCIGIYMCSKAAATCMESCKDLDRLGTK